MVTLQVQGGKKLDQDHKEMERERAAKEEIQSVNFRQLILRVIVL